MGGFQVYWEANGHLITTLSFPTPQEACVKWTIEAHGCLGVRFNIWNKGPVRGPGLGFRV